MLASACGTPLVRSVDRAYLLDVLSLREMEDSTKVGGARDSAGRPVSKLLVSSSHSIKREHHGDFVFEVPNNDSVQCLDPCFVGVSDLQLGNTGVVST